MRAGTTFANAKDVATYIVDMVLDIATCQLGGASTFLVRTESANWSARRHYFVYSATFSSNSSTPIGRDV